MILGGFLVVWGLACAAVAFPYGLVPGVVLVFLGVMRLTADQMKKRKERKAKEKARVKFEREQKAREDKLNTMRVFEDASSDSADYQCEETREIVTICNDDISGTRASTSEGLFWW